MLWGANDSVTLEMVFTCDVDTSAAPKSITSTVTVNVDNGSKTNEIAQQVSGTVQ